jgi:hypothetical protein
MLRIPNFLENQLTDGDNVAILVRQPPLYSPETLIFFF